MRRNIDLTALRSFLAVADTGGVTRAAGYLNLTQSAVSMQIKRLEESIGVRLFDRSTRSVTLTPSGEQLVGYARRMLDLNDEVCRRLAEASFEGEIGLGVPHDIVYPAIPEVLRQFAAMFPNVRVRLISSLTRVLKPQLERGELDIILTTEMGCDAGGMVLCNLPLRWAGAEGGTAWKRRPLPLGFEQNCVARREVQTALDRAAIPWEMAVDSESYRSVSAMVSADLAVHALLDGTELQHMEIIRHGGALPELMRMNVNLYANNYGATEVMDALQGLLRHAFQRN